MAGTPQSAKPHDTAQAGCLMRVRSIARSSSAGLQRLAKYILDNPDEVMNLTMEQLAESSGASYATIYRFCLKTGFSGYKEFKARLVEDLMVERGGRELSDIPTIDESSDTEHILDKVFDFATNTLADCRSILNARTVDAAVEAVTRARRILIVGEGTSGITARYAFSKLVRLGLPCHAETDGVLIAMQAAIMRETDLLLAISSSGRTADLVNAAEEAKLRKATVVSISDYAVSPLAAVSDIVLHTTPRNANLFRDIELPLIGGQITVIDALFSCIAVRAGTSASEAYRHTRIAVDKKRL